MALADGSSRGEATPTLFVSLQRDPQAPSVARAAVARLSSKSETAEARLATLTLLVSELVSNAVIHSEAPAASGIVLCARLLSEGAVRVEVIDQGGGFTAVPRDPNRAIGGYGLFLVDQQATRWGVDRQGGTRVWFELADSAAPCERRHRCERRPGAEPPDAQLDLNFAASSEPPVASPGL